MFQTMNATARIPLAAMAMLLLSASAFAAAESNPVTADNWPNHPRTVAVRDIYKLVEDGISSGRLREERRAFEYCGPGSNSLRVINIQADGLVRKYHYEGGSDDSALQLSHYYDGAATLRFVFITGGAVNGTAVEYRIYFDENGERFWHDYRLVEGPGYFRSVWPDEHLVRDPGAAFNAETDCPEK